MAERTRKLVVTIRPGKDPRRAGEVLRWIRWLLPAAILLVGSAPTVPSDPDEVITLDVDAMQSGPLCVADALARERGHR